MLPLEDPDVAFGERLWRKIEEGEFEVLGRVFGGTSAIAILEDSWSEVASEAQLIKVSNIHDKGLIEALQQAGSYTPTEAAAQTFEASSCLCFQGKG